MAPVLDLRTALHAARRQHAAGAGSVLDILSRSLPLAPAELAGLLTQQAGVSVVWSAAEATPEFVAMSAATCRSLGVVPLRLEIQGPLKLGLADPWDHAKVQQAARQLGHLPELVALPSSALDTWLGLAADVTVQDLHDPRWKGTATGPTGPVVDFVDAAVRAAFHHTASDVHFECDRQGVTVKLRQDGVMSRFAHMDGPERAEEVISCIKVLAQLDITERRVPQDGRFRFQFDGTSLDLRVSIMPSVHGEDAVLRLLDKAQLRSRQSATTLDLLGFDAPSSERIRELAALPHGMLLVTGPTGSGKTTTVYAVLSEINTGLEKIITIEDPVEYELPGVLQIPVNERKGLTFAKGLRSILRHDPDRILVGEIRDAETADIAVQSALTGHQVFTTVHANSVFDVTGRFRHFGIDMFGFMSALNGVIVQRLVRQLCSCMGTRAPSDRERLWLGQQGVHARQVPEPRGCANCHHTGYRGRMVIAEVHAVDDTLRDLVTSAAPVTALRPHILSTGVESLGAQAARKVQQGLTTPEEIRRVVGWL